MCEVEYVHVVQRMRIVEFVRGFQEGGGAARPGKAAPRRQRTASTGSIEFIHDDFEWDYQVAACCARFCFLFVFTRFVEFCNDV